MLQGAHGRAPRNPFDLDERDSNLECCIACDVVGLITSYRG